MLWIHEEIKELEAPTGIEPVYTDLQSACFIYSCHDRKTRGVSLNRCQRAFLLEACPSYRCP